ncbi:MAG: SRPBCC domain-containing protein [Betaproteobacteria bacterium]
MAKATGHGWSYWLRVLDKAGAAKLPHKEIVAVLYDQLGLKKSWWVQMVTVGYEQARGLRKLNQKADGFVATVSRTVAVPLASLFAAWEEGRRGDWLPDALEIRRATKNKSMRITWPDGSGVDVNFYDKGGNKAVVAIEQGKLPDEGAVAAAKQLWGSTLDRLKATLETRR